MIEKTTLKVIVILNLILCFEAFAQVKTQGTPFIKNYPAVEYQFHPKNFSVVQDNRGVMFFGNAYGVLEFDGNIWHSINLPDGKSGISVGKDKHGKIYIGSASEIGYLTADSKGRTIYVSLLNLVPKEDQNFGEVWNTFVLGEKVVFSSNSHILVLSGKTVQVFQPLKPEMVYDFYGKVNNTLYFRESGRGLLSFKGDKLELVNRGEEFADEIIFSILPYSKNELLVLSPKGCLIYDGNSFRPLSTPLNGFIKENQISKAIALRNDFFAIGTTNNGLLITDHSGVPVQYINKRNGLQSNYIYDLYLDAEDNLWVPTDNGISYVQAGSPFTSINEDANLLGMGYAATIKDGKLYLGTSQGVFVKNLNSFANPLDQSSNFKLIKNTEGQVFYLKEEGGVLLCGHIKGLYTIIDNVATKISYGDYIGGWTFKSFKEKYLLLGTFNGVEAFEKKGNTWVFRNKIKGFLESSRTMEIDEDENIWICHGNNGLYRLKLNDELDSAISVVNFSVKQGFKADYFNDIANIDKELVFAADDRLYKYNKLKNNLEKHDLLNGYIGNDILITKILQQKDGTIWIVNGDNIEVLSKEKNGRYVKNSTTFGKLRGQLIGSYEFFWRYNDRNCYIGTQNGFVHYDPAVVQRNQGFNVVIRKVESISEKDSLLFGGTFLSEDSLPMISQNKSMLIQIPYKLNALRFSYSGLYYEDQEKNQYQNYLEKGNGNGEKRWSSWSYVTYKEYTNLTEGKYTFHVRSKNIYGQAGTIASYSFIVLPPWYRTRWAYLLYSILVILILALTIRLVKNKIKREQQRIEKEKEKEILLMEKQFAEEALKAEKEIILLQNEKLESEVRYKKEELANLATNLSQKTEFLTHLKKNLLTISKEMNIDKSNSPIQDLIKTIDKGIEFDDTWDQFQNNFDTVHQNFLFKVREKYPFLKPTDLLLCAYIKMNKSNKEISSLLNISVSAVEKRRFRLREKLKLDNDTKLTEFLMDV